VFSLKFQSVLADVIAGPMILLGMVPVLAAVLVVAVIVVTVIIIRKRKK